MRNKVIDLLDQTIEELDKEKIDGILEIPPKDDMGDFAFPCFQLAKVFRKAPNMIATEIAEKIPASEDVSKVEAMGPYVNFFLNKENYVKEVLAKVNGTYGAQEIGKGKTVCIDYSSPNIAKNFHVGHLRTTIIGNSLYHIFDKLGYKVERINHLGDWGTQFGKLIVAYKKWGSKEAVEKFVYANFRFPTAFLAEYKKMIEYGYMSRPIRPNKVSKYKPDRPTRS